MVSSISLEMAILPLNSSVISSLKLLSSRPASFLL